MFGRDFFQNISVFPRFFRRPALSHPKDESPLAFHPRDLARQDQDRQADGGRDPGLRALLRALHLRPVLRHLWEAVTSCQ